MTFKPQIFFFACLLFAAFVVVQIFIQPSGWPQRQRAKQDLQALAAQNAAAEQTLAELKQEIEALQTNDAYRERVVREELGFVHPEDVVVDLGTRR